MSTVKTVNLQHASSAAPNLVLAADGSVTGGLPSPNRNLLYNGAMQVAQRGTSASSLSATGDYRTADRWFINTDSLGTWTNSVENDAPTGSGFRKSLKMLCSTANGSPSAGNGLNVQHRIEGQDLQRIAKGTASAQQLSLSFWVKANVTGTYVAELYDADNTRQVSASYTISASATWERKTITFPADTTGAFDNDNALSLYVLFWLGAGSSFTSGTLNTSWGAVTSANRAVGQTNLASGTNNYWQVTGVQLETGAAATSFEFKSYGQELRDCQRYYHRFDATVAGSPYQRFCTAIGVSTTALKGTVQLSPPLRAYPTGGMTSSGLSVFDGVNVIAVTGALDTGTQEVISLDLTGTGLTQFRPYQVLANNNAAAYLAFSAEL